MNHELIHQNWENLSVAQRLQQAGQWDKVVFSTSFGKQDQMITDNIARENLKIDIFTLDTGRFFPETYQLWDETVKKYQIKIKAFAPQAQDIQDYVEQYGINGFYDTLDARKKCCFIRKVAPLQQALQGYDYWISGLQRCHSENRADLPFAEYDDNLKIIKLYPLADVSDDALEAYIQEHHVPINQLHKNNFPSIGCQPCTRAIEPHEPARAGRWWWEQSTQECGLHIVNGKLVRKNGA